MEGSVEKGQEGVQIHSHVTIVTESTIFYTMGWMAGVAEEARAAQVLRYDLVPSPYNSMTIGTNPTDSLLNRILPTDRNKKKKN